MRLAVYAQNVNLRTGLRYPAKTDSRSPACYWKQEAVGRSREQLTIEWQEVADSGRGHSSAMWIIP